MQVLDRSRLMAIPPIWRLGFRPFFLGGALFAVLAIALWLAALAGLWSGWQPVGGWLAWHRHEMLFGFGVAIIAGFLLTAVQTWTGVPGLQGKPLALLAGLWLAARLAWLFDAPLALLLVLQLSFLPLLAWAIGRSLWRVRQKRNYPVVGLLLLLTLADALEAAPRPAGQGFVRQLRMSPMTAAVLLLTFVVAAVTYLGDNFATMRWLTFQDFRIQGQYAPLAMEPKPSRSITPDRHTSSQISIIATTPLGRR